MLALKFVLKIFAVLVALTLLGQIEVYDESLENRYHRFVNSNSFQRRFDQALEPARWVYRKALFIGEKQLGKEDAQAR